jgi:osomolarity two-component system, response regulator SSK1
LLTLIVSLTFLSQALSTIVNSSSPNSTVLLRLRVPSTSTSTLLAKESDPSLEDQDSKSITFEILQVPSGTSETTEDLEDVLSSDAIMKRILIRLDGSLKSELISSSSSSEDKQNPLNKPSRHRRIHHLSLPLKLPTSHTKSQAQSKSSSTTPIKESKFLPKSLSDLNNSPEKITTDPTLDILVSFVLNHLKGHSIALHSRDSNSSPFADEISKELLDWGCDVARFPISKDKDRINTASDDDRGSRLDEVGLKGLNPEEVEKILNQDLSSSEKVPSSSSNEEQVTNSTTQPEWQRSNAFFVTRSSSNPSTVQSQSQEMTRDRSLDEKTPRLAAAISGKDGRPSLVSFPSDLKLTSEEIGVDGRETSSNGVKDSRIDGSSRAILDPITGVPFTTSMDSTQITSLNQTTNTKKHSEIPDQTTDPSPNLVPFSYVLIDDDLDTLQEELLRLRSAIPLLRSALGADKPHENSGEKNSSPKTDLSPTRPPFQHRPRSSPQIQKVLSLNTEPNQQVGNKGTSNQNLGNSDWSMTNNHNNNSNASISNNKSPLDGSTCAIIYLTSISNYHQISELLLSIMNSPTSPATFDEKSGELKHNRVDLPQILVIPKPAGSRRLLTIMHSAVLKPKHDPLYQPLATNEVINLNGSTLARRTSNEAGSGGVGGGKESRTSSTPSSPAPMIGTPTSHYVPDQAQVASLTTESLRKSQKQHEKDLKGKNENALTLPKFRVQAASSETPVDLPIASEQGASSSMDITPPEIPAATSGPSSSPSIAAPSSIPSAAAAAAAAGVVSSHQAAESSSTGAVGAPSPARSSLPSSPMPVDALEYFTETAARMGNSAASGMVIQSPDGRPAGIFFRPQNTKHSTNGSNRSFTSGGGGSRRSSSETGAVLQNASGGTSYNGQGNAVEGRQDEGLSEASLQNQLSPSSPKGETGSNNPHPPTRLTRSRTSGSIQTTSETAASATSSSSPRTGSLFSPQIAIESVLSGSQPPMTTPLSLAFRNGANSSNSSSAQTSLSNLPPPPPSPKSKNAQKDEVETVESGRTDGKGEETLQVPGQDGNSSEIAKKREPNEGIDEEGTQTQSFSSGNTRKTTDGNQSEISKNRNGTSNLITKPIMNKTPHHNGGGKTLSTNQTKLNLLAPSSQARQSFASTTPAQAANGNPIARPSAMPQSGLLIGAGFTPKNQNRGGPKKAPVREVILPPIKVLIVEGEFRSGREDAGEMEGIRF